MQQIIAVADKIKQEIITAIAIERVVHPAYSDFELIECFKIRYAGNAFDLVRHSLLFSQIMGLMRLWDNRDDVRSIPKLARLLSDPERVENLVQRERQAPHDNRQEEIAAVGVVERQLPFSAVRATSDQREQEARARLSSWLANVAKVRGYPEVARLRTYRNKILAHSAWSVEQLTTLPYYGDGRKALELTIPVVSVGFRLATGIDYDFTTTNHVWDVSQQDLWEIVRSAARGERYSPLPRNTDDLARELEGKGSITIKG